MEASKPLEFQGKAGGYFVVWLVSLVMAYIPFLGWAFAFNFTAKWMAENTVVKGKKLAYNAGYGETLGFIVVNVLLLFVTLGIYTFWFVPKSYRYAMSHISEAGDAPAPAAPATPAPAENAAPDTPAAPEAPADANTPPKVQ